MRTKHRKLLNAAKKWIHRKWTRHDLFLIHSIVQGRHTSSPACYAQVHLIQSLIEHTVQLMWCCSREAAPTILSRILTPVPLLSMLRDFHRKYRETKWSSLVEALAGLWHGQRSAGLRCGSWAQMTVSARDATAPPWWPWSARQMNESEERFGGVALRTDSSHPGCLCVRGEPTAPW